MPLEIDRNEPNIQTDRQKPNIDNLFLYIWRPRLIYLHSDICQTIDRPNSSIKLGTSYIHFSPHSSSLHPLPLECKSRSEVRERWLILTAPKPRDEHVEVFSL